MFFNRKILIIFLVFGAILSLGVSSAADFNGDDTISSIDNTTISIADNTTTCIADNTTNETNDLTFFGFTLVMFKCDYDSFRWANTYVEIYDKDDGELLGSGYTDQYGDIWIDAGIFGSHNCEAFFYDDGDWIAYKNFYIYALCDAVTVYVTGFND